MLALAAVCACKINVDQNQPVAIAITLPDSGRVELTDTFHPRGRALNGLGDSVAAPLYWSSLDTATLAVVDSATGVSISKGIGTARLQARAGNLFSNPQTVTVLARLDSIRPAGAVRATVLAADSLSDSLSVQVFALNGVIPANRRVVFAVADTFPTGGPGVTLVPHDTVFTSATGLAAVRVRRPTGAVPDSVVITVMMKHVNQTAVNGSPLTFVVEFTP